MPNWCSWQQESEPDAFPKGCGYRAAAKRDATDKKTCRNQLPVLQCAAKGRSRDMASDTEDYQELRCAACGKPFAYMPTENPIVDRYRGCECPGVRDTSTFPSSQKRLRSRTGLFTVHVKKFAWVSFVAQCPHGHMPSQTSGRATLLTDIEEGTAQFWCSLCGASWIPDEEEKHGIRGWLEAGHYQEVE